MENFEHNFGMLTTGEIRDNFEASKIKESYENHLKNLKAEITKIKKYLEAKNENPKLENFQINEHKSLGTIAETLRQKEEYSDIIKKFEDEGVPEEILSQAKEDLNYLEKEEKTFSELSEVAENNPSLN
ncbi:MAG TPA: hypothetical protein PLQ20_01565 [Candidatus Paceibacterota bacterium]|nr:hypothetical protein [Candidatus Paceibacterota bacterium]